MSIDTVFVGLTPGEEQTVAKVNARRLRVTVLGTNDPQTENPVAMRRTVFGVPGPFRVVSSAFVRAVHAIPFGAVALKSRSDLPALSVEIEIRVGGDAA